MPEHAAREMLQFCHEIVTSLPRATEVFMQRSTGRSPRWCTVTEHP